MSKLEQVGERVERLFPAGQEALLGRLEMRLEDRLELKDGFKTGIERGNQGFHVGRVRIHNPLAAMNGEAAHNVC
jgi:hypothetical protein